MFSAIISTACLKWERREKSEEDATEQEFDLSNGVGLPRYFSRRAHESRQGIRGHLDLGRRPPILRTPGDLGRRQYQESPPMGPILRRGKKLFDLFKIVPISLPLIIGSSKILLKKGEISIADAL